MKTNLVADLPSISDFIFSHSGLVFLQCPHHGTPKKTKALLDLTSSSKPSLTGNKKAGLTKAKTIAIRIKRKKVVKGGITQITIFDGRNLLTKEKYKTGDSIVIEVPEQKEIEYLPLEKGAVIILVGGKHAGSIGSVEKVSGDRLVFKTQDNEIFETAKKHAYAIGKKQPAVKVR